MKKLFYILPFLLLSLLAVTATASARQEIFFPAELTYVDAQIEVMLPYLSAFQTEYHTINGRYYQALTSNTTAPDVPVVPDGINASPTDQVESLAFFWDSAALPDTLAWSFRIDTYAGPDGEGYVLTVDTVVNDVTYERAINFGPVSEDYRAANWYPVVIE